MAITSPEINAKFYDNGLEYVNYFPRQLITADDMRAEREYFREKLRRHNRMLHGWGVVCGCEVKQEKNWVVTIGKGVAITPQGDEICISEDISLDLASYTSPDPAIFSSSCSPMELAKPSAGNRIYLGVCYAENYSRPVRLHPAGCDCGCGEAGSEYARVREGYRLVCLDKKPESYVEARSIFADLDSISVFPKIPDCPTQFNDCCVLLARISFSDGESNSIGSLNGLRIPCSSTLNTYAQIKVLQNNLMPLLK